MKGDFSMEQFTPEVTTKKTKIKRAEDSASLSMFKVFLWMGLGLLITGVIALGMPDFLLFLINTMGMSTSAVNTTYITLMVVSSLLMLPSIILMNLKAWRPKSVWMVIGYVTYCVGMGMLLSDTMMYLFMDSIATGTSFGLTISITFLATAGCFLLMGLFGAFTKKNLGVLVPFLLTLMIGAMIISLVNFFLGSNLIYWIVDFVMFAVILLVVAIDMGRIRRLAQSGGFSSENNLAIYCAYSLYVDFINIFIRILYYVALARRND